MPPEVIKIIMSCLQENPDSIYNDDGNMSEHTFQERYGRNTRDYRSASLISRTIGACGQEQLFEFPVICKSSDASGPIQKPHLAFFVRTLLERQDLGTKVQQLTVFIPSRSIAMSMRVEARREGSYGVC